MATAEEILETMAEDTSEYEDICLIDTTGRTISIPDKLKVVGVESDEDVVRRTFRMPWQFGENDLSTFAIRINFLNARGEGDIYTVTDMAKSGDDMTFSWLLSRNATKYKGKIRFVVCMILSDGSEIDKEWNTTLAEFTVLEGLETTGQIEEDNPDILESILTRLDNLEKNGTGTVSPEAIAEAVAAHFEENPMRAADVGAIPDEASAVKREHIADLAINNAKLNYEAVSNAKIAANTIQKDRLAADALAYLTGGPYVSVSYDGSARADITQGRHVFALRLIDDSTRNLKTWLLNHSTYDGVYLHQGTDIEGPLKLLDRSDFIGGIHGNEQLVSMRMIADGVDITGGAVDLADVKTLSVYVTSTVYDTDNTTALFTREKVLTFGGTSLTVENRWTYTGTESVSVERWPGCGLYSTYVENTLGYTTNNHLIPSMDAMDADADIKEASFWVSGTRVTLQALRGMDGEKYAGHMEMLDGAARIKAYLYAIYAPDGYALNTGDVLEAAYRITIGKHDAEKINEIPKIPDSLPNPFPLTINGKTYDGSAPVDVTVEGDGGSSYTLPIATSDTLGGVKPAAKTDEMTQEIGVDADGKLWGLPGGSAGASGDVIDVLMDVTLEEEVSYIILDLDEPRVYKEFYVQANFIPTSTNDGNKTVQFRVNSDGAWTGYEFANVWEAQRTSTTMWVNAIAVVTASGCLTHYSTWNGQANGTSNQFMNVFKRNGLRRGTVVENISVNTGAYNGVLGVGSTIYIEGVRA